MEMGTIVLVDTTVIIEAHKIGCWKALIRHFKIETVEKCEEECATGNQNDKDRVEIDMDALKREIVIRKVERSSFATPDLVSENFQWLDPGEKELVAHAYGRPDKDWLISSQDRACIQAGHELGFLDRFVSLEEMAKAAGIRKISMRDHFKEQWLKRVRQNLKMGIL